MPKMIRAVAVAAALTFTSFAALAQATSPAGLWRTIDDETKQARSTVRITEAGGVLTGKIESIADPAKQDARCDDCKDDRKGQKTLGMTIIKGAKLNAAGDAWENGEILDPANGKVYKLRVKPTDAGKTLEVRGYMGPFFRTQHWQRIE